MVDKINYEIHIPIHYANNVCFFASCERNQTGISKDNIKSETKDSTIFHKYDSAAQELLVAAEISKETKAGTIYQSASRHHNVVHAFTYFVDMRDYCSKSLLQMRANANINKGLSEKLERELLNSNEKLTSPEFSGLQTETGLYERFLKQIHDGFRE